MANEQSNQIEEKPTTSSFRIQTFLIIVLLTVVVVSGFCSFQDEDKESDGAQQTEGLPATGKSELSFDQQVEQAVLQQQVRNNQFNQTQPAPPENDEPQSDLLGDYFTSNAEARSEWEQEMLVRVMNSRFESFGLRQKQNIGYDLAADNNNPILNPGLPPGLNITPFNAVADSLLPVLVPTEEAVQPANTVGSAPLRPVIDDNTVGAPGPDFVSMPAGRPPADLILLPIGTVFSGKLDQKLNSDYIGSYRAIIDYNVHDAGNRHVLIPAGSVVTGQVIRVGGINQVIKNRMGLSVEWVVRPDGRKIRFVSDALDAEGVGAVQGDVNYHWMVKIGGTAAFALLKSKSGRPDYSVGGRGRTFESDVGQDLREFGADIVDDYAVLIPTVTLYQGTHLRFFVNEDIYIKPWRSVFERFVG